MNTVPSRWDWKFGYDVSKFFTVEELTDMYTTEILTMTQKMFKYDNLPKSIPKRDLEFILQQQGYAIITKVNGELYAFRGGLGGEPNPYYLPTMAVVSNPALKFSKTLTIGKECVVIRNDAFYRGLLPFIRETAYLLAQTDISFKFATINIRIPYLISAPSDKAKADAKEILKQVEEGKLLGVVGDSPVLDKVNTLEYGKDSQSITHLIELKQYIWGNFLQRIGIQSQFNMKREAINESESNTNNDILFPKVDDMLEQRKEALEQIKELFGIEITVSKDSVWEDEARERDLTLDAQEKIVDSEDTQEEVQEDVESE